VEPGLYKLSFLSYMPLYARLIVVPLCDMRYLEHQVRMSHEENYKGMFTTTLTHSSTYPRWGGTRTRAQVDRADTFISVPSYAIMCVQEAKHLMRAVGPRAPPHHINFTSTKHEDLIPCNADRSEDHLGKGPHLANPRRFLRGLKDDEAPKKGDVLVIYTAGFDLESPPPGAPIYSDASLSPSEEVGDYVFLCTPTTGLILCSTTLSFDVDEGEGSELLTFQGIASTTDPGAPQNAAITGGTGRSSGAIGLVEGTNLDVVTFEIYFD
jgi:hypothetical protein